MTKENIDSIIAKIGYETYCLIKKTAALEHQSDLYHELSFMPFMKNLHFGLFRSMYKIDFLTRYDFVDKTKILFTWVVFGFLLGFLFCLIVVSIILSLH